MKTKIYDWKNKQNISIFSKRGKVLLRKYILKYNETLGGAAGDFELVKKLSKELGFYHEFYNYHIEDTSTVLMTKHKFGELLDHRFRKMRQRHPNMLPFFFKIDNKPGFGREKAIKRSDYFFKITNVEEKNYPVKILEFEPKENWDGMIALDEEVLDGQRIVPCVILTLGDIREVI